MSRRRVRKDAGDVVESALPRGPNGRALCRCCDVEVPQGRRTFCSAACVHEWKLTSQPTYVRQCLFQRDKGVCAKCGLDTVKLVAELEKEFDLQPRYYAYHYGESAATPVMENRLAALKISIHRWNTRKSYRGIWDADHIKPVVEGGGECGLDNYRTLCLTCHQKASAELAKRRKDQRKFDRAHRFKNRRLFP